MRLTSLCVMLSCSLAAAQPDLGNLEEIETGLSSPIYAASPPGDPSRLFIVQQGGIIRIRHNGVLQASPFLDVSALLTPNNGTVVLTIGGTPTTFTLVRGSEQGLLGLAFAPDYATSGVFYVNYVGPRGAYSTNTQNLTAADVGRTIIARFTRSAANPNQASTVVVTSQASVDTVLRVDQPFTNHNGGCIQFGPDGMLYIGMGDGGSGNDPGNRALDPNSLLGKMLRIDVSSDAFPADSDRDYAIPAGNPYAVGGGAAEVWARGVRNPWRWSFDRATGDLWIGDVGQDAIEEVDFVAGNGGPGRNYGWRVREGNNTTGLSAGAFDVSNLTAPVYTYTHGSGTNQGIAVTGGYVYRGSALRAWRGRYFFGDYANGRIWSAQMINGTFSDFQDHTLALSNLGTTGSARIQLLSSFGEDANGELYITQTNGRVRKIVPQNPQPCFADLDDGSGTGRPDFGVTIEDLVYFLDGYYAGALRADLDDGSGTGTFDSGVTIEDLVFFLDHFSAGC